MDEHEARIYRVKITDGEFVNIWMREKGRETRDGVEGIIYGLLHPKNLIEVGEYWAPIAL
jgi:hypothetical protein